MMKFWNIVVVVIAMLTVTGCNKESEEGQKYKGVDFKIEGLDYSTSRNGMVYEAQIPAEGAEFTIQEASRKNVHAMLSHIAVNDKVCAYFSLDDTTESHYEGAEWGSLDIDFNMDPTQYGFHISPNDTGETRKISVEFSGPYLISTLILTQTGRK